MWGVSRVAFGVLCRVVGAYLYQGGAEAALEEMGKVRR